MKHYLYLIAAITSVFSCTNNQANLEGAEAESADSNYFDTAAYYNKIGQQSKWPNEFDSKSILLNANGHYSKEEADKFNLLSFMGLFYDSSSREYSFRKVLPKDGPIFTVVTSMRGYVPIIAMKSGERCLFITNNPYMNKEILHLKSEFEEGFNLEGGKTAGFYRGETYMEIKASDRKLTDHGTEYSFEYRLDLNEKENGLRTIKSTQLSYIPTFDDCNVNMVFVGDLDGDGIQDWVINNCRKYTESEECMVLFSTKASGNGTPKPIAEIQVGQEWGEGC
jgi:hypothetical protein